MGWTTSSIRAIRSFSCIGTPQSKKVGNAHFFRTLARAGPPGKLPRGRGGELLPSPQGSDLVDDAILGQRVAHGDTNGDTEQIGILELHPGSLITIVEHGLQPAGPARLVDLG